MNPTEQRKMNAPNKEPKTDDKEAKMIEKMHQRFSKASQAVQGKHKQWAILDMFDRAEQWKDSELPPWVSKPVHNMIRFIRTVKRANLTGNVSAAHFAPLNPDHEDSVNLIQKAYKHVWSTQKVPMLIRRSVDRSILQGTSIAYVYSDDSFIGGEYYGENNPKNKLYQGEIRVKRIAAANFFPDPDADTLQDCKFCEVTVPTTLESVRSNKKFQNYAGSKLKKLVAGTNNDSTATGQIYKRDTDPFEGQQVSGDERTLLHIHYEYEFDENDNRKMNVTYYVEGYNFAVYREEDVKPGRFPFSVLYDEEEENDFWGTSTAMDILEKQKLINKTEQTVSIIATLNQNPQKIIARESGINGQDMARTGTMPGKVWTSNIEPSRSIFNIPVQDIPRGLIESAAGAKADIKDIAGLNEAYTGDSVGSLTTSTGVNSLIERATIRDKDKMKQIDAFVEDLSELIVLFILEKWTHKRPIINEKSSGEIEHHEWIPIKDIDHKNIQWYVKSDVYATAPTTIALRKQQANDLMQMQQQFQPNPPLITLEEWLKCQDYDNKEEILQRMRSDQEKIDQQKAADLASQLMQLMDAQRMALGQGQPYEAVNEQMTQQIQQILDSVSRKENSQGFQGESGDRNKDAQKPNQGPQGDTMAMANMQRGSL